MDDVLDRKYEHEKDEMGQHNPETCVACAAESLRKARELDETSDMHDSVRLKEHYGGYW